jgi:SAM-dependent methyltransferase
MSRIGFDAAFFPQLAALEDRNFWFRSRTRLIVWALGKYFPGARSFLEIGCGTGAVLAGVAEAFPALAVCASEPYSEGLRFARARVARAAFLQLDARAIPFRERFDVIGAFDVVEHIAEDEQVLAQMRDALVPGGGVLLTVPQHAWLWSPQDVAAGHVRRYAAAEMREKLARAGFEVVRMTSFVSLLLPAMLLSRRRKRAEAAQVDALDELRIGRPLNFVLERVQDVERLLIRARVPFPAGGSLLAVARRL